MPEGFLTEGEGAVLICDDCRQTVSSREHHDCPGPSQGGVCPECSAKLVRYKHTLNRQMAEALRRLAAAGGCVNLQELGLTREQWDNFQKMRYFGLVRKSRYDSGHRAKGVWEVTGRGYRFLSGSIRIPKRVETFRGQRTRWIRDELCSMRTLEVEAWREREDYSGDAERL